MTNEEIKDKALNALALRSDALHKEWSKAMLDESATPAHRVAVLADIHITATEFWTIKKMSAEKAVKRLSKNIA